MKRYLLAIPLLVALVACAPAATHQGQDASVPLIEYRRSGGIAGFDDHLVVTADGQATLTRRSATSTFTLDEAALAQLTGALDKAGFAGLRAEYLPSGQGADLFDYVVTYQGHTVHTQDGAVPDALQPALAALNEVIKAQRQ